MLVGAAANMPQDSNSQGAALSRGPSKIVIVGIIARHLDDIKQV